MARMTELEENTLRSLLSRFREEQPEEFLALVMQTLLIRVEDNSIIAFNHKDDDGIPDATFAVFKGYKPAAWATESLETLKTRLKDLSEEEN